MSINEFLVSLLVSVTPVEMDDKLVINEYLNQEAVCLTQNVYYEARNQPLAGQMAVMSVTLNRVKDSRYPDTICGVVKQGPSRPSWKGTGEMIPIRHKCQFSWFCDGKADIPEDSKTWEECLVLADILLNTYNYNYDFTEGATHYHNDTVHPYWADHLAHVVTIDNHIFYK